MDATSSELMVDEQGTLMGSTFGGFKPFGTATRHSLTAPAEGRESLIATWRAVPAGRSAYEERGSHHLDLKLRSKNVGPALLKHLEAADPSGTGLCTQLALQKALLLHFGIQLGARELACLVAEWQVMDAGSGETDYRTLCALATADHVSPGSTLLRTAEAPPPPAHLAEAVEAGRTLLAAQAGAAQ